MDVSIVERKLRETRFFLDHMRVQEGKAFGERERYDFYLSAFLSASRSVLQKLEEFEPFAKFFMPWRSRVWSQALPKPERKAANRLIEFFRVERNLEVHESGSRRIERETSIPIRSSYSDRSGNWFVYSPPDAPPTELIVPAYYLTIDGSERPATEACAQYLGLLERMVAKFKTDHHP